MYSYDKEYFEELCRSYGFARGLFMIYYLSCRFREAIDLVLEIDDMESFLRLMKNNPKTATSSNWEYVLQKKSQLESKKQSDQNLEIKLDVIISTMSESIGPFQTVDLLIQFFKLDVGDDNNDDDIPDVPLSIFRHLLIHGERVFQQKLYIHEILEQISRHLWSPKRSHVAPQFEMIEKGEIQDKEDLFSLPFFKPSNRTETSQSNISIRPELNFDYNSPIPKFF